MLLHRGHALAASFGILTVAIVFLTGRSNEIHSVLLGQGQGTLTAIDRFLKDQSKLDSAPSGGSRLGIRAIISRNEAEGDALASSMEEESSSGDQGAIQRHKGETWQVLSSADAAIHNAGFHSAHDDLLGNVPTSRIVNIMASTGSMPTQQAVVAEGGSLRQEMRNSQLQLGSMLGGGDGSRFAKNDMGLSESALQSFTDAMGQGLDVTRYNPADGVSTGQLAIMDSTDADRIAHKELRSVASGRLSADDSLVGMGEQKGQ